MNDTKLQSLLRGRIGATVLAAVSFGCVAFGLSPEETEVATDGANAAIAWVASGSSLLSGLMAFASKLREKNNHK
jgi:hypothetical protein